MSPPLTLLAKKRVWIPLALFAAYALFGFFALPGILRGQIVQGIRQTYGRELRLDRVRVNPLILSLTLEDFDLKDPDGTSFLAFDRLYIDFQVSSLVRRALTFREFGIDSPRVHMRLMPGGQPNFVDLVPKEEGKPPRMIIGDFKVRSGSVLVTNLLEEVPEEARLEPIDLTLENFTTIPRKEGLYRIVATDQGGGHWEWNGDLTFEPMHSAGVLEIQGSRLRRWWEVAQRRVSFEITEGRLGLRLEYAVDVRGDSLVARVNDSSLSLTGMKLRDKGAGPDLLTLDTLAIAGVNLRFPEQTADIRGVTLAGTKLEAWLNPDTTINWIATLTPPPMASRLAAARPAGVAADSGAATPRPAAPPPPWTVTLGELAIRDFGLAFEDRTTEPVFATTVDPLNLTVRNISTKPGTTFDVTSDVTIAERGRLDLRGTVVADPPAADLEVKLARMPLDIFQPYLNPVAKLQLVSGTVGTSGRLRFRQVENQPEVRYTGNLESRDFMARDRLVNEPFLAWKAVAVNAVDYSPAGVRVGSVRLTEPFWKLVIHRDRTTNLMDILGIVTVDTTALEEAAEAEKSAAAGKGKKKSAKPPPPKNSEALAEMQRNAAAAAAAPTVPIQIGLVEVVEGSADFADLSLILPFAARIEHLAGTVKGLATDSSSRATVELDGRLQPTGTAQVRGEMNPLAQVVFLDLAVVFRDFNMPVLTPYAGQFLGREIDKGRMSLDLGYRLQGRHLVGENKIVLDKLELGKKVESEEATGLPVGLAIAILKDGEGKIDLDVPVEGDLDDPKFGIGKIIWDFILSLLKKVATAPFALLGSLFGGGDGEELSHVDFTVGTSTLPPDQQESVSKLAEALSKRPQLSLEVRGRSDATEDAAAIRRAKFATFAGERLAANPKRYGTGVGYSPRLLEDLAVERFGKQGWKDLQERHKVAAGELPPTHPRHKAGSDKRVLDEAALYAAIQDTLTALQVVDEADLLSLSNARANAIKSRLMELGVTEERVYVLVPEPAAAEQGRVRIELALKD